MKEVVHDHGEMRRRAVQLVVTRRKADEGAERRRPELIMQTPLVNGNTTV
jgi:hypothetical protein